MTTIRQQAYTLINELSDDSVKVIIELMSSMDKSKKNVVISGDIEDEANKKRKKAALERMKKLRTETLEYKIENIEAERTDALKAKYGVFMS